MVEFGTKEGVNIPPDKCQNIQSAGPVDSNFSLGNDFLTTDFPFDSLLKCESPVAELLIGEMFFNNSSNVKKESAHLPLTVDVSGQNWLLDDDLNSQKCPDTTDWDPSAELKSPVSPWGMPMDMNCVKIDDVLQVDKEDLNQGPTLAELNANDESLLDFLNFSNFNAKDNECKFGSYPSVHSYKDTTCTLPPYIPKQNLTTLPIQTSQLLGRRETVKPIPATTTTLSMDSASNTFSLKPVKVEKAYDTSDKIKTTLLGKLLCSSQSICTQAPTPVSILSPVPVSAVETTVSSAISSAENVLPHSSAMDTSSRNDASITYSTKFIKDEPEDADVDESDREYDFMSSDDDSDAGSENYSRDGGNVSPRWTLDAGSSKSEKKRQRFFWQYNVQSKGPKGPKLSLSSDTPDPHYLGDVTDPVFSPNCHLDGVKHAGKARRGDGNDLTPNPKKLYMIGIELKKLTKIIHDLQPVSDLPFNARPKSRKEKNKLASRACRLKKKAQHEANKLKLYGIQKEHKKLMHLLIEAKSYVNEKLKDPSLQKSTNFLDEIDTKINSKTETTIAGNTTEFVNKVLDKMSAGESIMLEEL